MPLIHQPRIEEREGAQEPWRKRERVGCPEAMNSGSGCLSIVSMGVRKRGNGDAQRKRMDMCVAHGRIGVFRCSLYIPLSLPLVSGERSLKRTRALPHSRAELYTGDRILLCELLPIHLVAVAANLLLSPLKFVSARQKSL